MGYKNVRAETRCLSPHLGGGYLLSHFRSTIGVVRLNFSVRNGKRWDPHAITTLVSFLFTDRFLCRCDADEIIAGNVTRNTRLRITKRFENRSFQSC